jgi:YggT family protein
MLRIIRGAINSAAVIIELLLLFRLTLKFLAANPKTPFVGGIYGITEWLVAPFAKILPNWKLSGFPIDSATLAAIIVYAVIVFLVLMILPGPSKDNVR